MSALTFGSLFAGIGGMDLGLERAGWECRWQVEIDDYATRVLEKHWPHVERFRDIRDCGAANLAPVDLIAGGFPCQDISNAGKRAGITGERSGLWTEFARVVRELRPRYILVENVTALLTRGIGTVLGDLAALGYDAEWGVFSACAAGAPHTRERLFIVAYSARTRRLGGRGSRARPPLLEPLRCSAQHRRDWAAESRPIGVAYGVPRRVDRLGGLGNAVVPQVAEWAGRQILAHAELMAARLEEAG